MCVGFVTGECSCVSMCVLCTMCREEADRKHAEMMAQKLKEVCLVSLSHPASPLFPPPPSLSLSLSLSPPFVSLMYALSTVQVFVILMCSPIVLVSLCIRVTISLCYRHSVPLLHAAAVTKLLLSKHHDDTDYITAGGRYPNGAQNAR